MVGQHRSHTFGKSAFPWQYAINPESVFMIGYPWSKYGGPQKLDHRKVVKFVKVHFLHFVVVVAVVVVVLQFRLVYLNNRTELRNETLRTDGYP